MLYGLAMSDAEVIDAHAELAVGPCRIMSHRHQDISQAMLHTCMAIWSRGMVGGIGESEESRTVGGAASKPHLCAWLEGEIVLCCGARTFTSGARICWRSFLTNSSSRGSWSKAIKDVR